MSLEANLEHRLCIATLDPKNAGGILSMMRAVYRLAERDGLQPYLAYNRLAGFRGEREPHTLLGGGKAKLFHERLENMEGRAVERVLPEFEFMNYALNRGAWKEALGEGSSFFAVCGNPLAALPLLYAGKRYSLWVATTLYEDREDRVRAEPFLRKMRDIVSLPLLLRQERAVLRGAERILALSGYTRGKITEKYPEVAEKILVAPYPIGTDFFSPEQDPREEYALFTGRLEDPRKNILMLLQAFARVRKARPGLKLRLIGGRLNPESAAALQTLKLEDAVEVLPSQSREELRTHCRKASLFVLPSFQEGLCISALEALSCATPVVSTRCGGPEEFVHEGENGYLVRNNDAEAFAAAILRFLELPQPEREAMGVAARETVMEKYSEEKVWPLFRSCF